MNAQIPLWDHLIFFPEWWRLHILWVFLFHFCPFQTYYPLSGTSGVNPQRITWLPQCSVHTWVYVLSICMHRQSQIRFLSECRDLYSPWVGLKTVLWPWGVGVRKGVGQGVGGVEWSWESLQGVGAAGREATCRLLSLSHLQTEESRLGDTRQERAVLTERKPGGARCEAPLHPLPQVRGPRPRLHTRSLSYTVTTHTPSTPSSHCPPPQCKEPTYLEIQGKALCLNLIGDFKHEADDPS